VVNTDRGAVAEVGAQMRRARLTAAADAGIAMAVQGLAVEDRAYRWPIDGRTRTLSFDGATLSVTVQDERGKVPINRLDEDQARRLFAAAGADGARLDTLVDAFEDWRNQDDARRPNGAEAVDYAGAGIRPRDGDFLTVEEMSRLKGMDPALFARLAPSLTVNFGETGPFSEKTAGAFALGVMSEAGKDSPDVLEREREDAGERTAIDIAPDESLVGRPLTVAVTASDGQGGRARRSAIVELNGNAARPYFVRYLD